MSGRVLIAGGCATPMTDPVPEEVFYMLPFRAAKCLLDSLGLDPGILDFVILSSYDVLDGRMISNMYAAMASGAFLKYESRVSEDGTLALAYADALIRSNEADIGLVVGYAAQETDMAYASTLIMDPFIYRLLGTNYLAQLALQAAAYINRLGIMEYWDLIAGQIVSMDRRAGAANPRAHLRSPVDAGEVLDWELIVWPLRENMVPPRTRGAVALLLTSQEAAKKYMLEDTVEVAAIRWYTDSYYFGYNKLLYYLAPLARAAREAFRDAGLDPGKVDLYELSDVTPAHYLMELEALGVAPPGRAARLLQKGEVGPDAPIVVNRSGGSLSTDPYPATGLLKVFEAYLQLLGKAGPIQVDSPRTAVIHGFSYISGVMAQTHSVVVLTGG